MLCGLWVEKQAHKERWNFLIKMSWIGLKKPKCPWAQSIFIGPLSVAESHWWGFLKASLLRMRDSGVQEGQVNYALQTTGTTAGLLEANTLEKMKKGQNTPT